MTGWPRRVAFGALAIVAGLFLLGGGHWLWWGTLAVGFIMAIAPEPKDEA